MMNQRFNGPINNGQFAGDRIININTTKVCPSCEIRFLTDERQWCRHCEDEYNRQCQIEASQRRKNKILFNIFIFIFSIVAISWLLQKFAPEPISQYANYTFFGSVILGSLLVKALS